MDLQWGHLFSNTILKRGLQYYQNGNVYDVRKKGNTFTATVKGNDLYQIKITVKDTAVKTISCSCPYGRKGHFCKHMAAVLFAIDQGEYEGSRSTVVSRHQPKQVELFPQKKEEENYQYYDLAAIASNFIIWDTAIEEAKHLIREGIIVLENIKTGYHRDYFGKWNNILEATGIYKAPRSVELPIMFSLTKDQMRYGTCAAPGCHLTIDHRLYYSDYHPQDTLCSHMIALLLLVDEHLEKNPIGDATDYGAYRLLNRYRQQRNRFLKETISNTAQHKDIKLEPRLEVDHNGQLSVSFRIGKGKMYVAKNLPELVKTEESRTDMPLGTKETLSFASSCFEDSSDKYYRFIKEAVKGEALRNYTESLISRYDPVPVDAIIKRSLPLYGTRLDDFYDLAKDDQITFIEKDLKQKKTGTLLFRDRLPELFLTVQKELDDHGRFEGVSLQGEFPRMTDGLRHQYFFENGTLNRAKNEDLEILELLREDKRKSRIHLLIGRKSLSEFYYRLLPEIQEFAHVDQPDQEEIANYLYPDASFAFYLDAVDGNVSCDAKVIYGENVFRLGTINDDGTTKFRDQQRESEAESIVTNYFPYYDEEQQIAHCNSEEDQIYQILEDGVDALLQFGEVQATDRFKNLTIRKKPQITVGVRMESDLLNLSISSNELSEKELIQIINSYRKKKKYHRLKSGDFVNLENDSIEELSDMMDIMQISSTDFLKGKLHLPLYRALYLDKMLEKNESLYTKRDQHFKGLVKEFKTVEDSNFDLPESLQNIARGYQQYGFKWLKTLEIYGFGGILADDMGLGKTLQMIAVLLSAKESGAKQTSMIITPASLVYNWIEEFSKFAPTMQVTTITGTKAERKKKIANLNDWDVVITSYDLLKRDIDQYETCTFDYQVIDEAQFIKNHNTAAAKAVKALNSRIRFALTGTPIENRLSELWSIFDYLMPGFLYPYERFRKEIEAPIVKNNDEKTMARLKRMVEPFILRRLKKDVLKDLPDKVEETHYVTFDQKQQELYDGQATYMKQLLEEQSEESFQKSKIQILAELTRIRQICCDPSLCFENYHGSSAKMEACMDLIQSAIDGEHKILVFSQFTSLLELLEKKLNAAEISYCKITGATKKEDRTTMVHTFNEDDTPVFLISLKAGGTGLNLTGADIVIHFDPWWNVAAQNQATDRAHRIGQRKTVSVYKLIVKNSIEEKILHIQENKQALADEILSGETGGIFSMSKEELLSLL